MREREPERPRADGGRLQVGGRRSPEAGRTAGPAPPGRQRRTGYYQRMNREDGSATANQPEAFSSSSGYEAPPEQAAPDSWREAQPDNQVLRPPDAVPSGRRRFGQPVFDAVPVRYACGTRNSPRKCRSYYVRCVLFVCSQVRYVFLGSAAYRADSQRRRVLSVRQREKESCVAGRMENCGKKSALVVKFKLL